MASFNMFLIYNPGNYVNHTNNNSILKPIWREVQNLQITVSIGQGTGLRKALSFDTGSKSPVQTRLSILYGELVSAIFILPLLL